MKGKIPTFAEFQEMRRSYQNDDVLFGDIMGEFGVREGDDFYDWWNNYSGDEWDEVEDFLKRYSKLGKLLAGVDDV